MYCGGREADAWAILCDLHFRCCCVVVIALVFNVVIVVVVPLLYMLLFLLLLPFSRFNLFCAFCCAGFCSITTYNAVLDGSRVAVTLWPITTQKAAQWINWNSKQKIGHA